jgi:hypothetical protein
VENMMISAVENDLEYVFTVSEGSDVFEYRWGKEVPEGQSIEEYLQMCKRESLLLAQHEITKKQPPTVLAI